MKQEDKVKILGQDIIGTVMKVEEDKVTIVTPNGVVTQKPDVLQVVLIVFEVYELFKDIFTVKLPNEIGIGDRKYCLNTRYDHYEQRVFAYYRDELHKETLVGTAHGKNTNAAKKKLKQKIKDAGYL